MDCDFFKGDGDVVGWVADQLALALTVALAEKRACYQNISYRSICTN